MNAAQKGNAYKVVVTGSFDYEAYLRMSGLLKEFGNVQSTFFDGKGERMEAAATFMVSTVHDVDDVRVLLAQISGVTQVHVEANHA